MMRGYAGTRCKMMMVVMDWAESMDDQEITASMISYNVQNLWMTELNVIRLGEILWGFMNQCVSGEAREVFDQANLMDGFNAWRHLIYEMRNSSWVRIAQLRKLTKNVPRVTRIEDVSQHIMKYESNLKEYIAAAGEHVRPTDNVLKEDLAESLPQEIRESIQWRLGAKRNESYVEFRNDVRATLNNILYHRGKLGNSVNTVGKGDAVQQPTGRDDEDGPEDMMNYEQLEEMLAMMKRTGAGAIRFPRRNGARPGRTDQRKDDKAKPNSPSTSTRKCINCGEAHDTRECPKPQLSREQRPCWKCGKPGHIGAQCPNGPNKNGGDRAAGMVAGGDDQGAGAAEKPISFFCVNYAKEEPQRPMPSKPTLASFVHKNQFEALESEPVGKTKTKKSKQTMKVANNNEPKISANIDCKPNNLECDDVYNSPCSGACVSSPPPENNGGERVAGVMDHLPDEAAAETRGGDRGPDVNEILQALARTTDKIQKALMRRQDPDYSDFQQCVSDMHGNVNTVIKANKDKVLVDNDPDISKSDPEVSKSDPEVSKNDPEDVVASQIEIFPVPIPDQPRVRARGRVRLCVPVPGSWHSCGEAGCGESSHVPISKDEADGEPMEVNDEAPQASHDDESDRVIANPDEDVSIEDIDPEYTPPELVVSDDEDEPVKTKRKRDMEPVELETEDESDKCDDVDSMMQDLMDYLKKINAEADARNEVMCTVYEAPEAPAEINSAEQVKRMRVAADSGAVDHIANPKDIPGNAVLRQPKGRKARNFVDASGGSIKNHGEATLKLKTQEGKLIGNTFQVADVCRPLHSVGRICDAGHDMIFLKDKAVVVPEGALSKFLKDCMCLAVYHREEGLYVADMEATPVPSDVEPSFPRQGVSR